MRRGKILLALIIAGVVGVIILLVVWGEMERISKGILLENVTVPFLVEVLIVVGVVVPLFLIFNKLSPGFFLQMDLGLTP